MQAVQTASPQGSVAASHSLKPTPAIAPLMLCAAPEMACIGCCRTMQEPTTRGDTGTTMRRGCRCPRSRRGVPLHCCQCRIWPLARHSFLVFAQLGTLSAHSRSNDVRCRSREGSADLAAGGPLQGELPWSLDPATGRGARARVQHGEPRLHRMQRRAARYADRQARCPARCPSCTCPAGQGQALWRDRKGRGVVAACRLLHTATIPCPLFAHTSSATCISQLLAHPSAPETPQQLHADAGSIACRSTAAPL